jgi:hypothetical protein
MNDGPLAAGDAPEGELARVFSDRERGVVAALVEALLSSEENGSLAPPPGQVTSRVVREFDDWIACGGINLPYGFSAILLVIEVLPVFLTGKLSRMSRLPLPARVEYLEALEATRIGLLATLLIAVKVPLLMLCYEVGDELLRTGFDRPSLASRRALPVVRATETPS